jgi:hypothetical protein
MPPTMPRPGTQTRRILDMLLEANGEWVSKQRFIRELFLTQSGARIFELENGHRWPIEHSKDSDSYGFKSYSHPSRNAHALDAVKSLPTWPGCHEHGMHFATS